MTRSFARAVCSVALAAVFFAGIAVAQSSLPVLQPLADKPGPAPAGLKTGASFYVPATPDTVRWGALPDSTAKPVLSVPSGAVVTFDTVSHEGVLEDQGRDPVKFFGTFGVPPQSVLKDAQALAASKIEHDFVKDGPHLVIGPVEITGAQPGDVLKIEMVSLTPRVPYGIISNRHGKGALPNEFPETPNPESAADAAHPDLYHNVFRFVSLQSSGGKLTAALKDTNGRTIHFPAAPFMGTMGVTPNQQGKTNSVPPGAYGGNLDLRYLTAGSTLYLPVQLAGAMFFISDPHFVQGDGETALTAVEGSLRTTLRLTVLKQSDAKYPFKQQLKSPFAETPDYWIAIGLDPDLNEAMKSAVRNAIGFLSTNEGLDRATAMAYLSAGSNFEVTQVVDKTKGVHAMIRKADFTSPSNAKSASGR
jgi:acetamidase/formamidase